MTLLLHDGTSRDFSKKELLKLFTEKSYLILNEAGIELLDDSGFPVELQISLKQSEPKERLGVA